MSNLYVGIGKAVFVSLTPEELARQIREARAKQDQGPEIRSPKIGEQNGAASGKALRAAADLTAALLVGGFLGYWTDRWLHTTPLFMIAFFFLGFAAGFLNIYRSQTGHNFSAGRDSGFGQGKKKTDTEE